MFLKDIQAQFAAGIDGAPNPHPWALAVSGGSDSLALMHLASELCRARNWPAPAVLTVDHGLRPEAAREAGQVALWAAALGLKPHILRWSPPPDLTRVQQRAREARYRLLGQAMDTLGLRTLMTAHTADDQAETIALRRAAGSGDLGLAGLPANSDSVFTHEGDSRLSRPVLGFSRKGLRGVLESQSQPWIEDPANSDSRFARARLRKAGPVAFDALEHARALRLRTELETEAARLLAPFAADRFGVIRLAPDTLRTEPLLADVLLAAILRRAGGAAYPGTRDERARLLARLTSPGFTGATLARVRVAPSTGGALVFHRDTAPAPLPETHIWDGRFDVRVPLACPEGTIEPLGPDGLKLLDRPDGVHARALWMTPALRNGNNLVADALSGSVFTARRRWYLPFSSFRLDPG